MKRFAKMVVATILGWQVRRLRKKNTFKIVGVAGSIGKTSTKFAIGMLLSQSYKVRFQAGNYNDLVSVPLVFFGREMPRLTNPFAWMGVFLQNELSLHKHYPYDIVVVEIGTDGPGQIKQFGKYLELDMAVVTAIAPEHMEFFKTIEQIVNEEFAITVFSKKTLINADLCHGYLSANSNAPTLTYGIFAEADYIISDFNPASPTDFVVKKNGQLLINGSQRLNSNAEAYSVCAAVAVANELGMPVEAISEGAKMVKPINGRLRRLKGVNQSEIIDDTYNSSPVAAKAALDLLYEADVPQRIALLGNMNELGDYSEAAHVYIGKYCRPDKLSLVVTIGPDANKYLAATAKMQGCNVAAFYDPISAGEYIKKMVQPGALILAKGSQNGVFAEEAVKILLADPADQKFLVRQSSQWLKKKSQFVSAKKAD